MRRASKKRRRPVRCWEKIINTGLQNHLLRNAALAETASRKNDI